MRKRRRGRRAGSHCEVGVSKASPNDAGGALFDIVDSTGESASPCRAVASSSTRREDGRRSPHVTVPISQGSRRSASTSRTYGTISSITNGIRILRLKGDERQ